MFKQNAWLTRGQLNCCVTGTMQEDIPKGLQGEGLLRMTKGKSVLGVSARAVGLGGTN